MGVPALEAAAALDDDGAAAHTRIRGGLTTDTGAGRLTTAMGIATTAADNVHTAAPRSAAMPRYHRLTMPPSRVSANPPPKQTPTPEVNQC